MRTSRILGAATAALAVAHAAPALAAYGPLRRHLLPSLAGQGDPRHVALTFDDVPHEQATPELLDMLDAARIKATFFLLGRSAAELPEITREIVRRGHEIGVQGYEHRMLPRHTPRIGREDLALAVHIIRLVTGVNPRWWRPPYGMATTSSMRAAGKLGLRPVLWTCHGCDEASSSTADSVYRGVMRNLAGGGTLLLHHGEVDGPRQWRATLGALPAILRTCRARGLTVGPLRDHSLLVDVL